MSGGNCPETPRQKMVGMMYLMLTAMLALNVSGDLLNAFILVDESIKGTTQTVENKTTLLMQEFTNMVTSNPQKVGELYRQALEVSRRANELYALVDEYKQLMVEAADYTTDNYRSAIDPDVAAQVMIVEQNGERSRILKRRIAEYRDYLRDLLGEDSVRQDNVAMMLQTNDHVDLDGVKKSWQSHNFEHIPLASSMSLMSKIQNDVRNTQADVISYLYNQIDAKSFKFNKVTPLILPKSSYVLRGEQYEADIVLAAYDSTMEPTVSVGRNHLKIIDGMGHYTVRTRQLGRQHYKALMQIPDPTTGEPRSYEVEGNYEVGEPMVVVSPALMNVAYLGIENPLNISAAGIPTSSLTVTAIGGHITQSGDKYTVRPLAGSKTVEINVSANIDGKIHKFAPQNLRVVRMPDPVVKVGGRKGGYIAKKILTEAKGLVAEMENFYADGIRYEVKKFKVIATKQGFTNVFESNSSRFTSEQLEYINTLYRGGKLIIEEIWIEGPDGQRQLDGALSFTING